MFQKSSTLKKKIIPWREILHALRAAGLDPHHEGFRFSSQSPPPTQKKSPTQFCKTPSALFSLHLKKGRKPLFFIVSLARTGRIKRLFYKIISSYLLE